MEGARAVGEDAAPRGAEPVHFQPQFFHQRYVARVAAVVVAGYVSRLVLVRVARRVREAVPDRRAGAVGEREPSI